MSEQHLPAVAPAALPTATDIANLLQVGDVLVKSGLLPQTIRTAEAAAVVVMKGHELGLPPMAAIEGISVVQGRAIIGAHLMLALVKRAYGPGAIWVSETNNDHCTISYRVPGVPQVLAYSFTMADARQAGLADKPTWRQYPAAMLRARAISAAVKLAFPEVVGGMYVAGELPGTEEHVTPDGDVVISVTARPVAEAVDIETGEIVAPEPPQQATAARSRRTRQTAQAEPVVEAAPEPTLRSLGERAFALAVERGLNRDQLIVIGEEITGKPKTEWGMGDVQALVAHLEAMPMTAPADAELAEAG